MLNYCSSREKILIMSQTNCELLHGCNSGYLKTTHLPPLDLTKSLTRRLVGSNKESKHRQSSNKNSNPLSLSVDSADLPDTENKKKSPKNIEPIETSFILDNYGPVIKNYSRNLETPVTIDILTNESGRNSRQSLGHITNRDILSSRFSSRPDKDSCYYHPEKLSALKSFIELPLKNLPKMACLEEVPKVKDPLPSTNPTSSTSSSSSTNKLDPIRESKLENKLKTQTTNNKQSNNKPNAANNQMHLNSNKINLATKPGQNCTSSSVVSKCGSTTKSIGTTKPIAKTTSSICSTKSNKISNPIKLDSSRLVVEKNRKQTTNTTTTGVNAQQQLNLDIIGTKKLSFEAKPDSAKSSTSTVVNGPSQPLIYTMFEGFPQPFASKSVVGSSASSLKANSKSATSSRKMPFYGKKSKTTSKSKNEKCKTNGINKKGKNKPDILVTATAPTNVEKSLVIDYKSYELEEFEHDDDDNDQSSLSSSSSTSTLFLIDEPNRLENLNKSEPDISGKLLDAASAAQPRPLTTSISLENLDQQASSSGGGENRRKRNSITARDFISSFEQKFFAIYNKFDQLLNQQENNLERSSTSIRIKELNAQKAQFIDETAKELNENVNFDEISSDPELIQRLKDIYDLIKTSNNEDKKEENNNNNNSNKLPGLSINENSKRNSLKSNNTADIREIYSIVNSFNKTITDSPLIHISTNRKTSANAAAAAADDDDDEVEIGDQLGRNKTIYHIPLSLTDKINTMLTLAALQNHQNQSSENEDIPSHHNRRAGVPRRRSSKNDSLNKSKHNSFNAEDSDSNETTISDTNSISYHFDFKYRDKSPINFRMDNVIEFKWKRGDILGKGAFGSVYQAMLSTGEIIAVKQIEMEESDPTKARKEYESVREEVNILRQLKHENIVQFMGTMLEGNVVNIFMELIPGGTIDALLKTYGPFEEDLFRTFANQILEGVNYIHSRNVVHRDIKGKNIMLMSSGIIKLIDFGCAKRLKKNQSSNSLKQLFKSLKGTPYWMSPEVIKGTGHGSKADIWSTGATIFEMATGLPPWGQLSPISAIYAIGSGEASPPELPAKFSDESRDLVKKCLTREPELRPSAAELLNHPFFLR